MSKIVSNFFISLDGVVERPDQWHFPYFNEQMGAEIGRGSSSYKAFLMGRVLYEEWANYWPSQGEEVPFASFINNVPKYVVSNSLVEATWNNTTVVAGDVARKLRELKNETDGDIGMSGSATLVRSLLDNDLLDELALMIHPIVVGKGQRLFEDSPTHPLELKHNEAFETGVLYVRYAPATK
jgi:dihydrofolate reductase